MQGSVVECVTRRWPCCVWPAGQPFVTLSVHPSIGAYCLVGLVVKASTSRAEDPRFESCLCQDFSRVESYQWLKNWHSSGYPAGCLVFIGSVLGLVGPVSAYCDWVRWKIWSATSVSVWQHVKLSEQIRPWDTLSCCWDAKQATNKRLCVMRGKKL